MRPQGRTVVLGGGHGVANVISALRDESRNLTVIVTVADDGGSSGELRRRQEGPAIGDLRRALIALAGDETVLARAFRRPLTMNRLGRHPLGNLIIRSLADGFGDLVWASEWLGQQLGIRGRVLPATAEPVSLIAETEAGIVSGESAIGASAAPITRLRFDPEQPIVVPAAVEAIAAADCILLGPGSLFTSVLAASAVPDIAAALARSPAPIVWISNLRSQVGETSGMTALDHLKMLRAHHVRVDAVLYDPESALRFTPGELERFHVEPLVRRLHHPPGGGHDPALLGAALRDLFFNGPGRARPAPV